jgi:Fur family ferric uptake transcriptional regulator
MNAKEKDRAWEILSSHLQKNGLQSTSQRHVILDVFLSANSHVSVDELLPAVKAADPKIGHTTVFRTLKILCECGIAEEVILDKKVTRFEPLMDNAHHDHLVCTKCGKFIEAVDPEIERLQERLCQRFRFTPRSHRLQIMGICKDCMDKGKRKRGQ